MRRSKWFPKSQAALKHLVQSKKLSLERAALQGCSGGEKQLLFERHFLPPDPGRPHGTQELHYTRGLPLHTAASNHGPEGLQEGRLSAFPSWEFCSSCSCLGPKWVFGVELEVQAGELVQPGRSIRMPCDQGQRPLEGSKQWGLKKRDHRWSKYKARWWGQTPYLLVSCMDTCIACFSITKGRNQSR